MRRQKEKFFSVLENEAADAGHYCRCYNGKFAMYLPLAAVEKSWMRACWAVLLLLGRREMFRYWAIQMEVWYE